MRGTAAGAAGARRGWRTGSQEPVPAVHNSKVPEAEVY
jgi:hypothetical protein